MAISHIHTFKTQDSSRDAKDDAEQIRLAMAGNEWQQVLVDILRQFYEFTIESSKETADSTKETQEILTEILKTLRGESGEEGEGPGGTTPPVSPIPSGGGGSGGMFNWFTSTTDKIVTPLDRIANSIDELVISQTKNNEETSVLGLLTTNLSDLPSAIASIFSPEDLGQKVYVTNFADFKFDKEKENDYTQFITPIANVVAGALYPILPKWLTGPQLFGEDKNLDQSFQISNWDESGIHQLTQQVIHLGTILNSINDAVGGFAVGALKEEEKKSGFFDIPIVNLLSSIIDWFGTKEQKENEGVELVSLLELVLNINETLKHELPYLLEAINRVYIELVEIRELFWNLGAITSEMNQRESEVLVIVKQLVNIATQQELALSEMNQRDDELLSVIKSEHQTQLQQELLLLEISNKITSFGYGFAQLLISVSDAMADKIVMSQAHASTLEVLAINELGRKLEAGFEQLALLMPDMSIDPDGNGQQPNVIIEVIERNQEKTLEVSKEIVKEISKSNDYLELLTPVPTTGNEAADVLAPVPTNRPQWPANSGTFSSKFMKNIHIEATKGMTKEERAEYGRKLSEEQQKEMEGLAHGGFVPSFADGGFVPGQDGVGENEDEVNIKATKGEYVVNKKATEKHKDLLEGLNSDHFAMGGTVGHSSGHYFAGGLVEIPAVAAAITALQPVFTALAPMLVEATASLGGFASAVTIAAGSLYVLSTAVGYLTAGVSIVANVISKVVGAFLNFGEWLLNIPAKIFSGLVSAFDAVNDVMSKFASGDIYGMFASMATNVVGAFAKVTSVFDNVPILGTVFNTLTGTATGLINAFAQFMGVMTPFVQQISPAIVEQFNRRIADLQATMGIAFQGIVAIMADTIAKMGGILLPIAEELQPVFNELGELIQSVLLPILKVFATIIQLIIPSIQNVFSTLRTVIIDVVRNFVMLSAIIARMFGNNNFIEQLLVNLRRPDAQGALAVGNVTNSTFEAISRDVGVAAAQASLSGAGNAPRNPADIMADVLVAIGEIRNEGIDDLAERIDVMIREFREQIETIWQDTRNRVTTWWATSFGPGLDAVLNLAWSRVVVWLEQRFPRVAAALPNIQALPAAARLVAADPLEAVLNAWDWIAGNAPQQLNPN